MYRVFAVRAGYRRLAAMAALLLLLATIGFAGTALQATQTVATADRVVIPIIMYHGILKDADRQGQYVISPALFESDLAYIREAGYTTVVMADLLAYVRDGTDLPEKPIILTFDDGYYNNYAYAYPLLKQYGMRAVLSPVVAWSEFYSNDPAEADRVLYSHVTWAQLREMADSGVLEIQNHSYDMHKNKAGQRKGTLKLAKETLAQYHATLKDDLSKAQAMLTEQAGVTPTTFTYPFGAMSREAIPVLEELGFSATLTCEGRLNTVTRDPACLWGLGRYLRPAGSNSATYFTPIFRAADAARTH
ncbi:MAG: polysaccharide deacetylase family protein [Clostridia bacterium]|nr:polysaccharide deacetylase family protein [Clostridia bacterium]